MNEFDQFWAAYPRKTGKGAARTSFAKAIKKTTLAKMLRTLAWQRESEQWLSGFIPHPTTWLNQERWDDEPTPPSLKSKNARSLKALFG